MIHATVMTFNLRIHTPIDGSNAWPYRKNQAAELIRQTTPLAIGTQEGKYEMLRDLDAELPQYSRIGEGRAGFESGNPAMDECCAIYFRHELIVPVKHGQFWLSETPEIAESVSWDSSLPRFCTWACFQWRDRPDLRFYLFNTHFDHLGQQAREESAKLLLEQITKFKEEQNWPVVLTGDFNSLPDNPAITTLERSLSNAYSVLSEPVGRTFHDYEGGLEGEPIDYLFVSSDVDIESVSIHRDHQDGAYPSDHYPVSATLRLPSVRE